MGLWRCPFCNVMPEVTSAERRYGTFTRVGCPTTDCFLNQGISHSKRGNFGISYGRSLWNKHVIETLKDVIFWHLFDEKEKLKSLCDIARDFIEERLDEGYENKDFQKIRETLKQF